MYFYVSATSSVFMPLPYSVHNCTLFHYTDTFCNVQKRANKTERTVYNRYGSTVILPWWWASTK